MSKGTDVIKNKIDAINEKKNIHGVGRVIRINNYIIEVSGLDTSGFYERVTISDKAEGYVSYVGKNSVTVEIIKSTAPIYVGDEVIASGKIFSAFFSPESIGKVVDIFGEDKIAGRVFKQLEPIEVMPPVIPISDRVAINRPMYTGISCIDMMYPIGRGQRQLIIGDKKTGKTQIALDAIVNQKGHDTICIYVALGKTKKTVKEVYADLLKRGAMEYTIILAAFQDDGAPAMYLTPEVGLTIAHKYMNSGKDVLVVLDDLTNHANVYREISLLAGKVPGRDAYPADVFHLHAALLEQGCQHKSGGSITVLPIVETRGGEITDYISTNIISITDGQLVLSQKAFERGQKPAIDFGLSVSRLGGAVQTSEMRVVGADIRREFLSYLETREVFELVNMDEMNENMRMKIERGLAISKKFVQYKYASRSLDENLQLFSEFKEN